MIIASTILLCLSSFALVYHYALFPYALKYFAKGKSINTIIYQENELPKISILLAVYNEEAVIKQKTESTFKTSYPLNKIEFLIGSDASTDETDTLINGFISEFPQISLTRFKGRTGKPQIINELEKKATGEILILTDANVFFEKNTLYELTKHYKNPEIGVVGGNILNLETKTDGISKQEKKYLDRENVMKYHQGIIWGAMMGAFGGLYSMRKTAYVPVPKGYIVDDFYLTMKVLNNKLRAINELQAIAYEDISNIPSEEFRRKTRIGTGNFQNLFHFKSFLFKGNGIGFNFISHKVLRWKGPFFILTILGTSLFLGCYCNYIWLITLGTLGLLSAPLLDISLKKLGINNKLLRYFSHFVMMNLALLVGFIKFAFGKSSSTWTPTKRNQ